MDHWQHFGDRRRSLIGKITSGLHTPYDKMKKIAIYGAGGFGREVACLIHKINEVKPEWELIGFFDDNPSLKGQMISHYAPCFGGWEELNNSNEELAVAMAIGNAKIVKPLIDRITNEKIYFPSLIHPRVNFNDFSTVKIGKGNIIQGGCFFSCDVEVGDFNVLNGSVVLGHDDRIGSYNIFMPAVRVSGQVTIGDENYFGVGAIILQQLKIGNDTRIGAGCVLMTKPKDGCLYIGNPAKRVDL